MGSRKKQREVSSSSSDSSDSSEDEDSRKSKKRSPSESSKNKKEGLKKRKHDSTSSDTSSSSSSSSSSEEKKKKLKKQQKKGKKTEGCSSDIPLDLMAKSKSMAPMTKEEWEKKQSVVKRVYDESTGRHRLIKGDGEVIEEIVSRERHKAINQQATKGDGDFFQAHVSSKIKK